MSVDRRTAGWEKQIDKKKRKIVEGKREGTTWYSLRRVVCRVYIRHVIHADYYVIPWCYLAFVNVVIIKFNNILTVILIIIFTSLDIFCFGNFNYNM